MKVTCKYVVWPRQLNILKLYINVIFKLNSKNNSVTLTHQTSNELRLQFVETFKVPFTCTRNRAWKSLSRNRNRQDLTCFRQAWMWHFRLPIPRFSFSAREWCLLVSDLRTKISCARISVLEVDGLSCWVVLEDSWWYVVVCPIVG